MTMSWVVQAAMISIAAGLGLGFAIRFSLVSRVQDRSHRVAPQLGDAAPVMTDAGMRRSPTA